MLKAILAATTLSLLAAAQSASALKTSISRVHDVVLYHKQFDPIELWARHGDRIRICNKDKFQHRPFSLSSKNKFEAKLKPGECHEFRVNDPHPVQAIKVHDSIHSQERMVIHVERDKVRGERDAETRAPRRPPKWVVYVDEKKALCCTADEWQRYPNKRKGEIPLQLLVASDYDLDRRRVRVLRDGFEQREDAVDWVCRHRIVRGGRWTRNYARINGVLVGNTPCKYQEGPPF